jgi:SAP domain
VLLGAAGGLDGNKQKSVKEMKVSEIKAELDMRGISHSGLYEKRELVHRLEEARALGQADPAIVDKFNKKMLETRVDPEMKAAMDEMANDPDLLDKIKASGKATHVLCIYTHFPCSDYSMSKQQWC